MPDDNWADAFRDVEASNANIRKQDAAWRKLGHEVGDLYALRTWTQSDLDKALEFQRIYVMHRRANNDMYGPFNILRLTCRYKNLSGMYFRGADLLHAVFIKCTLNNANFCDVSSMAYVEDAHGVKINRSTLENMRR
jgi:uncharacterized protein YjbI with pentapeptide repeats